MSLVLQSLLGGDFKPHPEGIHPAVCVDVIDLGQVESDWQGQRRVVHKVRLVFQTEQRNEEGKNCIVTKTFTASLNAKAKLAEFLGKWRGRPVVPGESIDLGKLVGACCTLVISHQQNMVGRTYAAIDAVSKPTKKVVASGHYDPAMARQRIAEARAREGTRGQGSGVGGPGSGVAYQGSGGGYQESGLRNQGSGQSGAAAGAGLPSKSGAAGASGSSQPGASGTGKPEPEFDPEIGF